jgi:hypothetical protein
MSNAGGIMMAANNFLQGATAGRIRAYEQRENQKLQKLNQLYQYMTNVCPTLTPEGQNKAMAIYSRAIGAETLGAMDQGGKGKKGKQGEDQQPGNVHAHFTSILKDIATGMVGGKMPKGAQDVDPHAVMGQIAGIASDPKFNKAGVLKTHTEAMEKSLEGYQGYYEGAAAKLAPHLQALANAGLSSEAAEARTNYLSPYPQAPKVGSPEYYTQRWSEMGRSPAQTPPPPPSGPTGTARQMFDQQMGVPGAAPQQQQQQGPPPSAPNGRVLSPTELMIAQNAGVSGPMEKLEYEGPDGKLVQLQGQRILLPDGAAYFDGSGQQIPVDASKIRKASLTEPRQPTYQHGTMTAGKDVTLEDGTKVKKGQLVDYRITNESGAKPEILGLARQPAVRAGAGESAASKKWDRQVKMYDALATIIEETDARGGLSSYDAKGNAKPLEGAALARAIVEHARQYYRGNPKVAQYIPDIIDWANAEARKGTIKGDALSFVKDQAAQSQDQKDKADMQGQFTSMQEDFISALENLDGGGGGGTTPISDK